MLVSVPPPPPLSNISTLSSISPAGGLGLGGLTGFGLGFGFGVGGHEKNGSTRSTNSSTAPPTTATTSKQVSVSTTTATTSSPGTSQAQTEKASDLSTQLTSRPLAIVLSPSTLITVLPLSLRDRVQWREERGDYEVALGLLGIKLPKSHSHSYTGKEAVNGSANAEDDLELGERVYKKEEEEGWEEDERRRIGRKFVEVLLDEGRCRCCRKTSFH